MKHLEKVVWQTTDDVARDLLRDAALALDFVDLEPELAEYARSVASLRAHAAGWLLEQKTKAHP